jgi:SAM-dependent methyltransferase
VTEQLRSSDAAYRFILPYLRRLPHPRILEVGSGYGIGLCDLLKRGLNVVGIEPGRTVGFQGRLQAALELLALNGIPSPASHLVPAVGEYLPFKDDTFDLVFSTSVLEHVHDIRQCLQEAIRVAKPGGVVVHAVPNYDSFKEGHYNIIWLPYLLRSKGVAKWYVRTIFGRQDYFIDELHFTTPRYFSSLRPRLSACQSFVARPELPSRVMPRGMPGGGEGTPSLLLDMASHLANLVGLSANFRVVCHKTPGSMPGRQGDPMARSAGRLGAGAQV